MYCFEEKFQSSLCDDIASMARKLCTSFIDPDTIHAYTACRLIALDKNAGVHPISIGEVLHG